MCEASPRCFSLIIEKDELSCMSHSYQYFADMCHHIRICVFDVANCKLSWCKYVDFPNSSTVSSHTGFGQVALHRGPILPYIINKETEVQAEAITDMCLGGRGEPPFSRLSAFAAPPSSAGWE